MADDEIPLTVPKLGLEMEDALVVRWLKHPGEKVEKGEHIVEIETDKATYELEAPGAGELVRVLFDEGSVAPVLEPIAWIRLNQGSED